MILLGVIAVAVGLAIGGTAGVLLASAGGWAAIIAGIYLAVKLISSSR